VLLSEDPANRKENIGIIQKVVLAHAQRHSKRFGVPTFVEYNYICQVYDAAVCTAKFHQIDLDKLSHKKELAHLGFWIADLKPVTFEPPPRSDNILTRISELWGKGVSASSKGEVEGRISAADEAYLKAIVFPINESICIEFIMHYMYLNLVDKIKNFDAAGQASYEDNYQAFMNTFMHDKVFENIMFGLRYHVFTPRSFATLIESVFAFSGSPPSTKELE